MTKKVLLKDEMIVNLFGISNSNLKYRVLSLVIFWLVLLMGSVFILKNHRLFQEKKAKVKHAAGIKLLNMLMPKAEEQRALLASEAIGAELPGSLIEYYRHLGSVMPDRADAHHTLGVCYYYKGQKELAIDHLRVASTLAPYFFWTDYNLGILMLEAGRPADAEKLFYRALTSDPRQTLNVLASSKIYHDILRADTSYDPVFHLKNAYVKISQILQQSRNGHVGSIDNKALRIKIF